MQKAWKQLQHALTVGSKPHQAKGEPGSHGECNSNSSASNVSSGSKSSRSNLQDSGRRKSKAQDVHEAPCPGWLHSLSEDHSQSKQSIPNVAGHPDHSFGPHAHSSGLAKLSKQHAMNDSSTSSRMTCSTHFTHDSSTSSKLLSADSSHSSKYSSCAVLSGSHIQLPAAPTTSGMLHSKHEQEKDSFEMLEPSFKPMAAPPCVPAPPAPAMPPPPPCALTSTSCNSGGQISAPSSLLQQQQQQAQSGQDLSAELSVSSEADLLQTAYLQQLQGQAQDAHPAQGPCAPPTSPGPPLPAFMLERGSSLPDAAQLQASHCPGAHGAHGHPSTSSLASISCSAGSSSHPLVWLDAKGVAGSPRAFLLGPAADAAGHEQPHSRDELDLGGCIMTEDSDTQDGTCSTSHTHPSDCSGPGHIPLLTPMVQSHQSVFSSSPLNNSGPNPMVCSLVPSGPASAASLPKALQPPRAPKPGAAAAAAKAAAAEAPGCREASRLCSNPAAAQAPVQVDVMGTPNAPGPPPPQHLFAAPAGAGGPCGGELPLRPLGSAWKASRFMQHSPRRGAPCSTQRGQLHQQLTEDPVDASGGPWSEDKFKSMAAAAAAAMEAQLQQGRHSSRAISTPQLDMGLVQEGGRACRVDEASVPSSLHKHLEVSHPVGRGTQQACAHACTHTHLHTHTHTHTHMQRCSADAMHARLVSSRLMGELASGPSWCWCRPQGQAHSRLPCCSLLPGACVRREASKQGSASKLLVACEGLGLGVRWLLHAWAHPPLCKRGPCKGICFAGLLPAAQLLTVG